MKTRRSALCLVIASLVLTVLPGAALANAPNNESATYEWILLGPPDFPANVAIAPNGDTATLTGSGTFGVHPKSATGSGTLTHAFATGGSITVPYTVTELISFQPYGCGVGPVPLPPNACGGKLEFRISIAGGAEEGILTIYCLISDDGHVPQGAAEGPRLNIPGVINFNEVVSGANIYFKQP